MDDERHTIRIRAFYLSGALAAEFDIPHNDMKDDLLGTLAQHSGVHRDALRVAHRDGIVSDEWSPPAPKVSSELDLYLQVMESPHLLSEEQRNLFIEALHRNLDRTFLKSQLPFSLCKLRTLTLGATDCPRLNSCNGQMSNGILALEQLESLSRVAFQGALACCTSLAVPGVLDTRVESVKALATFLKHMPQVERLDLAGNLLGHKRVSSNLIGEALQSLSEIRELSLACNSLFVSFLPPGSNSDDVLASIGHLSKLAVLDLHLNDKSFDRNPTDVCNELIDVLAPSLSKLSDLQNIDLQENNINLEFLQRVLASVPPRCTVNCGNDQTDLRWNDLLDDDSKSFRPPLLDFEHDMQSQTVVPGHFLKLRSMLSSTHSNLACNIRIVDLSNSSCFLYESCISEVLLPAFSNLTSLNISRIHMDDLWRFLCKLPEAAPALKQLNMSQNWLGWHCRCNDVQSLGNSFARWGNSLEHLDLSGNFDIVEFSARLSSKELSTSCMLLLAIILPKLVKLKSLNLGSNGLNKFPSAMVSRTLTLIPDSLEELDLIGNGICQELLDDMFGDSSCKVFG
eukprot:TRINITY_DN46244_c0_g1_i1.p1 TRINITY_DN46244_c0_g1~~TRINITY_DN46244_c0_g1_i1.p1  ORF type:complete len:569 (-),score=79.65 TRINITY_DN46244_c0_g1_i1:310-2016(-)